jgi:hypothetical protein
MKYVHPTGEVHSKALPRLSLMSKIKDAWLPEPRVVLGDGQTITPFYIEQLERGENLYIVAGESAFAFEEPKFLAVLDSKLEKGATVSIIMGPHIKSDGTGNPLIERFENGYPNFFVLYIDKEYAPKSHFAIGGRDVLLEDPHDYDTPAVDKRVKIIYNSIERRYECVERFKKYVRQSSMLSPKKLREKMRM